MLGCKYFITDPSETVKIIFPPHSHLPIRGGLRYFSLQATHLKVWDENFLRFPFVSLKNGEMVVNTFVKKNSKKNSLKKGMKQKFDLLIFLPYLVIIYMLNKEYHYSN